MFGSRATGRARPNSDIDLVLYGPVRAETVARIAGDLEESWIEVRTDVLAYDLIEHPPLRAHIDQVARTLFTRADLRG